MKVAPTIGDWLQWHEINGPNHQRLNMLWHDVRLVLEGQFEHLFRVFVKDEPHKAAKIKASKWRLIIASALPVQMVWRMAFHSQNLWLNENYHEIPSSHGFVFPHGGWRRFKALAATRGLKWSRDISGWDVNAPGWVFAVTKELRKRWGGPPSWEVVVDQLYYDAFVAPRLLFSNGVVVEQEFSGFMKSGLFNTISDNSLAGSAMHIGASIRSSCPIGRWIVTGDDVLQSHYSEAYGQELEKLGCKIKCIDERLSFMGTDFTNKPEPEYFSKHVVKAACSEGVLPEVLDAYMRLYCHSDKFSFWLKAAQILGVEDYRSRAYCMFWYDSPLCKFVD